MPKVPRDISHKELCKALGKYGYAVTRQTGSHIRLKSDFMGHEHSITTYYKNKTTMGDFMICPGNVRQLVQDSWKWDYSDAPSEGSAQKFRSRSCVIRGGSWFSNA